MQCLHLVSGYHTSQAACVRGSNALKLYLNHWTSPPGSLAMQENWRFFTPSTSGALPWAAHLHWLQPYLPQLTDTCINIISRPLHQHRLRASCWLYLSCWDWSQLWPSNLPPDYIVLSGFIKWTKKTYMKKSRRFSWREVGSRSLTKCGWEQKLAPVYSSSHSAYASTNGFQCPETSKILVFSPGESAAAFGLGH